ESSPYSDLHRAVLDLVRMPVDVLKQRVAQACSIEYWRSLVSSLSIGNSASNTATEGSPLDDARPIALVRVFRQEGVLRLEKLLNQQQLSDMRLAVETLEAHDWPAVFVFVFDAFWTVPRSPSLRALAGTVLGARYSQSPSVWVHIVRG